MTIMTAIDQINALVLTCHGRSGSMLMQTLFDSHPQVISFPSSHLRYDYRGKDGADWALTARRFMAANPALFNTEFSYFGAVWSATTALLGPDGADHARVDGEAFVAAFARLAAEAAGAAEIDRRRFFCLLHLALAESLGFDPFKIKYILFHQHSYHDRDLGQLLADFPHAYMIATIRDPREGNLSWLKVLDRRRRTRHNFCAFIGAVLENRRAFSRLAAWRARFDPDHVRMVDLNRLHIQQDQAMRALADWLGVEFCPSLRHSTVVGLTWWGNDHALKPRSGFDPAKAVYRYPTDLPRRELEIIEYFHGPVIAALGYAPVETKLSRARVLQSVLFDPQFILGDSAQPLALALEQARYVAAQSRIPETGGHDRDSWPWLPLPVARILRATRIAAPLIGQWFDLLRWPARALRVIRASAPGSAFPVMPAPGELL